MVCELQVSADFIACGSLGAERYSAIIMLSQRFYSYIVSDDHYVKQY
jgi:hypothetical protein